MSHDAEYVKTIANLLAEMIAKQKGTRIHASRVGLEVAIAGLVIENEDLILEALKPFYARAEAAPAPSKVRETVVPCTPCKGTGKGINKRGQAVDCPRCNGAGARVYPYCNRCEGTGFVQRKHAGQDVSYVCDNCGGLGYVTG